MRKALSLFFILAALPLVAAEIFFEGRLVSGDSPVASTTVVLTPKLFSEPVHGKVLDGWPHLTVSTDEDGYFAIHLPPKDLSRHMGELWLGGTVDGVDGEVFPRKKLVPAPYAIHTKSAALVTVEKAEGLSSLSAERLEADDVESGGPVLLTGNPALPSSVKGVHDLHLGRILIGPGGSLSVLSPVLGPGAMTQEYDSFQADGSFQLEKNEERGANLTAKGDGFLVVVAKSDHSGGQAKFFFSLKVGDVSFCRDRDIDTDNDPKGLVFTVPVRKGESVAIKGRCKKSGTYWHRAFVKYRFFYFGR